MKRFLLFFAALWLAGMSMMNASTCADLNAVTSTSDVPFTLDQVTVVHVKAPYIYVQDATGTSLVYSNWNVFKRLNPGDVVSSITGNAKQFKGLPELMPTDSMISKTSGTAPVIPDATAAPTTADINKVLMYRDVNMGSQSFPSGSAVNKTGTFSGGSVTFRNAWKEAYQFDATKTYDILGCVSIYGSTIQVFAAEIQEHSVQPVDTITPQPGTPITVRLFPSHIIENGWNNVYLYAWTGDSTKVLGNWPGTAVEKSNGWYTYTFPANVQNVNLVWSNGAMNNANQTEDIMNVTASTCYRLGFRTTMIDDYATNGIHYEADVIDCSAETTLKTMYEVNQAADGTPIAVRPLIVTFAKKPYFYVQDFAGTAGLIYDTRNEWTDLAFNDIITGFEGNAKIYNGLNEMVPSISYVDWEVRNKQAGEEIAIPVATSAPTAADMNKVFRFENVSFGSAAYTTQKANITATMANGETFAARNQWGEAYTFDANKTYDMVGAVAVYNGSVQVYVTNFVEHQDAVLDPIVVRAEQPSAWGAMYLYAWKDNNEGTLLGDWPGTRITPDNNGWCNHTFEGLAAVNYIWNDGLGTQTENLRATGSVCQRLLAPQPHISNPQWSALAVNCDSITPFIPDTTAQPTGITLGFQAPVEWDSVYIYYWNSGLDNVGWPGVKLTQDNLGWSYFTFPNGQVVNYLWNNGRSGGGTNQTVDLTANCDKCERVGGISAEGTLVTSFAECGSARPAQPDTVTPITPDTTHQDTIPQGGITVKMLASSVHEIYNCKYLNLYAWQTAADGTIIGTPLGGWPGRTVPLDSATGWYQYTFDPAIQDVNIIWSRGCDGGYKQTQDIMHLTYDNCFQLMGDSTGIIAVGANCSIVEPILPDTVTPIIPDTTHHDTIPQPQGGITIKLSAMTIPASWEEVRLYSWTAGVDSALRTGYGLTLQADSGWYKYTFPADLEMVDLLFNNGSWGAGNQTVDLRMFADACVGFGEADETTDYKFPLLEADCLTGEVTPIPVDSSAHTVYIWDNISRIYWDSIVVPYGGDVTLPTDLPEYEGYHFVFWEGLYDGSNVLHDVKTDMWMQAKYYINLPEEPAFSPVTVRLNAVSVPESWGQVYIYSWTPGAMDSVRWPGALMQMDDNGWYTYTFPAGVQDIDFLFDNGDGNVGNQTVDVDNVSSNYCFEMAAPLTYNGFYMVYPTDCSEIPQPEGMTIRLMRETNMGGWYFNNYIYAWQHIDSVDVPLLGQWPGAPMQLDDNGWFTYTFREEYDSINIVFSAGDVQTVDILGVTGSSCFQIGKGNGWINGMYVHNVKQVDCDVQPWQYHLVYFLTNNGTILDLQYVVDGDSAIAPDAPLIPGYEFVGWDKDFSHVTENMTILPIYRSSTPVEAYTVRLMPTNGFGWEDIYLYAWTTDSLGRTASQPLGSWPGTKIEKDSLTGWHSYTFEYDPVVNIIWNNGLSESSTYQTQDIMGVSESTCYRLYGRDSLFHLIAEPISCETNLADYRTVAFISGGVQMINQQPVGSHIEETPTIPYREGYTFAFWADSDRNMADSIIVTEDIAIYAWWSRNSYMVYILDGLTGELIISGEILYGNSVNNLDYFIPEHEGYEFIGWTNDLQYIEGVTFTIAQFRPSTYGNTSIVYSGKDGELLDMQNVDLDLPVPPVYDGFTFIGWQVVGGDLNRGIQIQAVYQDNGGTGAPDVNGENRAARKVIRDNKVYVITPEGKVFSSDGKLVEVEK